MSRTKGNQGTVGTLNTLASYRRYLHGDMTTGEFQVTEGGYSVQPVEARRESADAAPMETNATPAGEHEASDREA